MISKRLLTLSAYILFAIALFQAAITTSIDASRYFGAWKPMLNNPWLLYISGFSVSLILAILGFYLLSAAGYIRRLPLLRFVNVSAVFIFLSRGLFIIPEILINEGIINTSHGSVPAREVTASAFCLLTGIIYLFGLTGYWKNL